MIAIFEFVEHFNEEHNDTTFSYPNANKNTINIPRFAYTHTKHTLNTCIKWDALPEFEKESGIDRIYLIDGYEKKKPDFNFDISIECPKTY